jgi:hypothetical protein
VAKSKRWTIVKEVIVIDRSKPKCFGGMHYEFHSTFEGTEVKVTTECNKLQRISDKDHDESLPIFTRITFFAATDDWIEGSRTENIFEMRGFGFDVDYESLSKEELIKLLKEKK